MNYHDHTREDDRISALMARTGKPHIFLYSPDCRFWGEWLFEGGHSQAGAAGEWCIARDETEGRGVFVDNEPSIWKQGTVT